MPGLSALALALALLGIAAAASLPPVPTLPSITPRPIPEALR